MTPERLETRESAACSNPDSSVGLFGECIQVAVVPDQAVIHVVVAPAGAIPDVHAVLGARPQPSQMVEFKKVNQSVAACPLNALLDRHATSLRTDTINAASKPVADPHDAIRPRTERKHLRVAQSVSARQVLPPACCEFIEPAGAPGPNSAIRPFGNCPHPRSRQFGDARESPVRRHGHEEACFGGCPQPLFAIEAQFVHRLAGKALPLAKPLCLAGSRIDAGHASRLSPYPNVPVGRRCARCARQNHSAPQHS